MNDERGAFVEFDWNIDGVIFFCYKSVENIAWYNCGVNISVNSTYVRIDSSFLVIEFFVFNCLEIFAYKLFDAFVLLIRLAFVGTMFL